MTFQTRCESLGLTVGIRLIARDTVAVDTRARRSEEHTSELQSQSNLVCRLLLEKKKKTPTHLFNSSSARRPDFLHCSTNSYSDPPPEHSSVSATYSDTVSRSHVCTHRRSTLLSC